MKCVHPVSRREGLHSLPAPDSGEWTKDVIKPMDEVRGSHPARVRRAIFGAFPTRPFRF